MGSKSAIITSPAPLSRSLKPGRAAGFPGSSSVWWRIIEVWVAMIVLSPAS